MKTKLTGLIPEENLIPYHATVLTGKKVLVLAPHPDDETLGCGGSLALHRIAGDPVKVVFLTNGARGDSTGRMDSSDYVAVRKKEACDACEALDVRDSVFWDYEDRSLIQADGVVARLAGIMKDYRPQLVYATSPLELHPDHRATAFFLWCALCTGPPIALDVVFYEVGYPVWVNLLVDITPVLDHKGKAVACYESQLRERPYGDITMALNRFRSLTLSAGISHAEGFFLWNSVELGKDSDYGDWVEQLFFNDIQKRTAGFRKGSTNPFIRKMKNILKKMPLGKKVFPTSNIS